MKIYFHQLYSGWTTSCWEKLLRLPGSNGSNGILFIGIVNGANDAFADDAFIINWTMRQRASSAHLQMTPSWWKVLCMLEVCTPIQRKRDKMVNRYLKYTNGKYRILSGQVLIKLDENLFAINS